MGFTTNLGLGIGGNLLDEAMTWANGQTHWDENQHYNLTYTKDDIMWRMEVVRVDEDDAMVMSIFDDNHVPNARFRTNNDNNQKELFHSEIWDGTIKHINNLYSRAYQRFAHGEFNTKIAIVFELFTKQNDDKEIYCPFSDRMIDSPDGVEGISVIIAPNKLAFVNRDEDKCIWDDLFPHLSNKWN